MKVFLSAIEKTAQSGGTVPVAVELVNRGVRMRWNLMSYYYAKSMPDIAEFVRDNTDEILIDSGAHSFQKGKKVDWEKYTHEYAAFIKRFDRPNVLGYFEMDVDNVLGYEKVKYLRNILIAECGHPTKIIPVWHKGRGIAEFTKMCKERSGHIVAITGFKNEDIRDEQYLMFVKEARRHNCKIHCLGMTRKEILEKVPFDYTDSSSWVQQSIFGMVDRRKVSADTSHDNRQEVFVSNYLIAIEMQKHFYLKWKKSCRD